MWKSVGDGDTCVEREPCICSSVVLLWHNCTSEAFRQPASVLEITQLVLEIRRAIDE